MNITVIPCKHCKGEKVSLRETIITITKNRDEKPKPPLTLYYVRCDRCGARTFDKETQEEAINAWNNGHSCY